MCSAYRVTSPFDLWEGYSVVLGYSVDTVSLFSDHFTLLTNEGTTTELCQIFLENNKMYLVIRPLTPQEGISLSGSFVIYITSNLSYALTRPQCF